MCKWNSLRMDSNLIYQISKETQEIAAKTRKQYITHWLLMTHKRPFFCTNLLTLWNLILFINSDIWWQTDIKTTLGAARHPSAFLTLLHAVISL